MSNVVMSVEGVLSESPHFDITMQPAPRARLLYSVLATNYNMVLLTSQENYAKAEHWLKSNGFAGYGRLITGIPEALTPEASRMACLKSLRSSRLVIDFVLDSEEGVVDYAASIGIVGMLWRTAWKGADRVDLQPAPIRSWDDMVTDEVPQ